MVLLCIAFGVSLTIVALMEVGNAVEAKRERERVNKLVCELTILWSNSQNQIVELKKAIQGQSHMSDRRIN